MLIAQNVHKSFYSGTRKLHVLDGIDLEIEDGEIVALLGPSGAGKSTLLHIMGGLDKPDRGRILIDGDDIYRMGDKTRSHFRNQRIGFVFQFYYLLPEFTTMENVIMPALISNRTRFRKQDTLEQVKERARLLLREVGLEHRLDHKSAKLSGGEQQRVAIARSLINKPDFVLCDEPTGNLDSATGAEIKKLLWDLSKKEKMGLVIATHDERLAHGAKRLLHIQDGVIAKGR